MGGNCFAVLLAAAIGSLSIINAPNHFESKLLCAAICSLINLCLPGTGCPKVINLTVSGELVEGNILTGVPEIAWCGGTPGKGVARFVYPIYSLSILAK